MRNQGNLLMAFMCFGSALGLISCGGSDEGDSGTVFGAALLETDLRFKPILASLPKIQDLDPLNIGSLLRLFSPGLKEIVTKGPDGKVQETYTYDLNATGYAKSGKRKADGKEVELFKATYETDGRRLKTLASFGVRFNDKGESLPSTETVLQTWDLSSAYPVLKQSPIKVAKKSEDEESITQITCASARKCVVDSSTTRAGQKSSYKIEYEFASPSILEVITPVSVDLGVAKYTSEPLFQKGLWSGTKSTVEFKAESDLESDSGEPVTNNETCTIAVGGKKTCSSVSTGGSMSSQKETSQMVISEAEGAFGVVDLPLRRESVSSSVNENGLSSKTVTEFKYDAQWRLKSSTESTEYETSTTTADENGENPVTTKETVKKVETKELSYVGESRRLAQIIRKEASKIKSTTAYSYAE
jgi:hypothetical protein